MAKRVKFTDTGTTQAGGYAVYDVTFDGQPFGQTWQVWRQGSGVVAWTAFLQEQGIGERGHNRGRAVAGLLVKVHGLTWPEAFAAVGVR